MDGWSQEVKVTLLLNTVACTYLWFMMHQPNLDKLAGSGVLCQQLQCFLAALQGQRRVGLEVFLSLQPWSYLAIFELLVLSTGH